MSASARFVVAQGTYTLHLPCPKCGAPDGWRCYPGEWPTCWRCGAIVLRYGRTPEAECVTPNGRIDRHARYMKVNDAGEFACAFCGK